MAKSFEEILVDIERIRLDRASRLPDERAAIDAIFDAYQRLKELGWSDSVYCPKDGSLFDTISMGSTGIHACTYRGEWPDGYFMVQDGGDIYPTGLTGAPTMFRARKAKV